jgi:phosphoglycolate phosphatase
MELTVEPGQVLLIGVDGQITVMKGNDFTSQYLTLQESFRLDDVEYAPTIKNKQDNRIVPLLNQARVCISKQEEHVMARQLTQKTKLFTLAGEDNYLMGKIGDYLVIRAENPQDMNIIKKDMFESYYVVK